MQSYGLPVLATLLVWWFSTGAILYLNGLPRRTFAWSMAAASLLGALALYGLWAARDDASAGGAYLAFVCALGVWGWNEIGFLLGLVTGPRSEPCPEGATGLRRFVYATQTIIHHEILILVAAGAIAAVTWGGANDVGLWTYLILWAMRLSTKLNIFLGVPNVTVQFLPAHLAHLKSYFADRPMNLLFPFSVTAATVATVWLTVDLAAAPPGSFEATGLALLATLTALGLLEHWFLVIPLPFGELWSWGLASRSREGSIGDGARRTGDSTDIVGAERGVSAVSVAVATPLIPAFPLAAGTTHSGPQSRASWRDSVTCAGASR